MKDVYKMSWLGFRLFIVFVACGLLLSTSACQELLGTSSNQNETHSDDFSSTPIISISEKEKENLNQQYFSNDSFRELNEIPEYVKQQLPFVPIRTYQYNLKLYFVVNPLLKATDTELITNLQSSPDYGGCSEIWTWDIEKETLQRQFVKLEYYPNPLAKSTDLTPVDKIGSVHGGITTIDQITANEEIFFTESIAEGMMHFTKIQYIYRPLSDDIFTVEYQPGRPEVYTDQEIKKMKKVSVTKETLMLFRKISDIVWEQKGKDWQWSYFTTDKCYTVQYNIKAAKKSKGEYYHEIGYFSLANQTYTPIIRKWISEFDLDPFISLELISDSNHLSIHDWCGFSEEPRTNQEYCFNSDEKTIQYMEEASHTTEETGVYEVVKR